ncbi:MAG: hypothetical protein NTY61_00380, partial [Candidatus Parcubacteria bacterium]|nr:hypothetical protein [Candidatus Parcubacteria bacterium]
MGSNGVDKKLEICYNISAGERPAGHESWQGFSASHSAKPIGGNAVRKSLIVTALVLAVVFMVGAGSVGASPFQDTGQPFALSPLGMSSQVSPVGDQEALIVSAPNAATGIDPGQIALVSATTEQYICAGTQDPEVVLNRDYSSRVVVSPMNIGPGSSTPRQTSQMMTQMSDPIGTYVVHDAPQDRGSPGPVAQNLVERGFAVGFVTVKPLIEKWHRL